MAVQDQLEDKYLLMFPRATKLALSVGFASACSGYTLHLLNGTYKDNSAKAAAQVDTRNCYDLKKIFQCSKASFLWDPNWDKRDPEANLTTTDVRKVDGDSKKQEIPPTPAQPTATRHLLLIRHGQYNLKGEIDEDRYLTELGREQAGFAGQRLKALAIPYTRIVQSSMTRAKQTASIISNQLPDVPIDTCDLLREGAPIKPVPHHKDWDPPDLRFHLDGPRIEAAFRKYFHRADPSQKEDSYEILSCHANVIRYFICRALQFPAEGWIRFSLHNCSITWIAIRPSGKVVVYSIGDTGHLPPNVLTTT